MSEFLFPDDEIEATSKWHQLWKGMPEFHQDDLTPDSQLIVSFESEADRQAFAKLVDQMITPSTRSIWYPKAEIGRWSNKRFIDEA